MLVIDVNISEMKNTVFLICVLALFVAGFASATHAHIGEKNASKQIELSADQDNTDNSNATDPMCDLHCAHHHHLVFSGMSHNFFSDGRTVQSGFDNDSILSSPVYGLKRPPRA